MCDLSETGKYAQNARNSIYALLGIVLQVEETQTERGECGQSASEAIRPRGALQWRDQQATMRPTPGMQKARRSCGDGRHQLHPQLAGIVGWLWCVCQTQCGGLNMSAAGYRLGVIQVSSRDLNAALITGDRSFSFFSGKKESLMQVTKW